MSLWKLRLLREKSASAPLLNQQFLLLYHAEWMISLLRNGEGRAPRRTQNERVSFFPFHSHAHCVFLVHTSLQTGRDRLSVWEHRIFFLQFHDSHQSLLCSPCMESGVVWRWVAICSLHDLPLLKVPGLSPQWWTRGILTAELGVLSTSFIFSLSFFSFLFSFFFAQTHRVTFICYFCFFSFSKFLQVVLLQPSVFPEWQSLSNAKLYLACTAAHLAPVPSAICPDRCPASPTFCSCVFCCPLVQN